MCESSKVSNFLHSSESVDHFTSHMQCQIRDKCIKHEYVDCNEHVECGVTIVVGTVAP